MAIKRIVYIVVFSLVFAASVFGQEDEWSQPVNGLRARIFILASDKVDSPFCRVFIEMQNTSDMGGQKKIRFHPNRLRFQVANGSGDLLPKSHGIWDGGVPTWEPIGLPWRGTIKFQISFPGAGYRMSDKVRIDMGPMQNWLIPQDGDTYRLSGQFTIVREKGDHPYMDWSGTLELPPVSIPKAKK